LTSNDKSLPPPIIAELADRLFSSVVPLLANLVVTALVTFALSARQFSPLLVAWSLSNSVVVLARVWQWRAYHRRRETLADPAAWMDRATYLAALTGLHWGALGLVTALVPSPIGDVLVPMAILGIAASIASTHTSHLPAIFAVMAPSCLMMTLGAALAGDALHWSLAGLYLLFLGNLSLVARRSHRAVVQTLLAKLDNERGRHHLVQAQRIAATGSVEHDLVSGKEEWSDEMFRLCGVDPGAFVVNEETMQALVHAEDHDRFRGARAMVLAGKQPRAGEFRIVRPDGEARVLYGEIEIERDRAGRAVRAFSVFKDVTELRAAERREQEMGQKLVQSQKLEALGTLAGGVAHEFNNALVPILALSKINARRMPENSREREALEMILKSSERARDLVKQILAFSRQDAPRRELVDLAATVREAFQMMRVSLPTTMRINERIDSVPPVLGDANQLSQVVVNLMTNAAQAIGEGAGTITVELAATEPGAARLVIADTGCGMDEATAARIFEPFFTTKEVGRGTGLGLAIVHGIVSSHGGRIEVDSRPGGGTRFTIDVPLASEPQAASATRVA
jgi:signal transduction histidine kinase